MFDDPSLLWLHIVAADPVYADTLSMQVCEHWVEGASGCRALLALTIDKDGDAYAILDTDQVSYHVEHYNAQMVWAEGTFYPCNDTTACYLRQHRYRYPGEYEEQPS